MPVSPQQHHQTIAVPPGQPLLASAGLVLVPASQQTNAAGTPFVWQVNPSSISPTSCSQMSFSPAENPAFFHVATGGTACHQGIAFNSNFAAASSPQIAATAIHFVPDYGQHSPEPSLPEKSSIPASSSIPDIVLTGIVGSIPDLVLIGVVCSNPEILRTGIVNSIPGTKVVKFQLQTLKQVKLGYY